MIELHPIPGNIYTSGSVHVRTVGFVDAGDSGALDLSQADGRVNIMTLTFVSLVAAEFVCIRGSRTKFIRSTFQLSS